jgi:hypothetical protein
MGTASLDLPRLTLPVNRRGAERCMLLPQTRTAASLRSDRSALLGLVASLDTPGDLQLHLSHRVGRHLVQPEISDQGSNRIAPSKEKGLAERRSCESAVLKREDLTCR